MTSLCDPSTIDLKIVDLQNTGTVVPSTNKSLILVIGGPPLHFFTLTSIILKIFHTSLYWHVFHHSCNVQSHSTVVVINSSSHVFLLHLHYGCSISFIHSSQNSLFNHHILLPNPIDQKHAEPCSDKLFFHKLIGIIHCSDTTVRLVKKKNGET